MERDLLTRMLTLSLYENIDVGNILFYSLTLIPMSLCHTDGAMLKTDKSVLIKILENNIIIQLVCENH